MYVKDCESGITQEELKQLLSYDPVTGVFTWLVDRANGKILAGDEAGHVRENGYRYISIDYGQFLASRLAFLFMTGNFPPKLVDHKNGKTTDNRWENLRPATHYQNSTNRVYRRRNKTGMKGVSFRPERQKFQASIRLEGYQKHLGYFATADEAGEAYKNAEAQYRGSYGARSA